MKSRHAYDPSSPCSCPVCATVRQQEQTDGLISHHNEIQEYDLTLPSYLILDRYRLLKLVGSGGFSEVYLAQDEQSHALVAVKQISLQGLSAQQQIEATETFNREVALLSRLCHPHLPRLLSHGSDAQHWYVVMQYLAGETLEAYVLRCLPSPLTKQPVLPVGEIIHLGLQLCEVLQYLHTRTPPIIFRDLKPSNIIRSASGKYSLVDFGIARSFKLQRPHDTIPFGSPGYAAPEQYGSAQTSPRSDLYSPGAILYQCLTGHDPSLTPLQFPGLEAAGEEAVYLELVALIRHLVAWVAEQRPPSAEQVARQLRTLQLIREGKEPQHAFSAPSQTSACAPGNSSPSPASSVAHGRQMQRKIQPASRRTSRRKVLVSGLVAGALLVAGGAFLRGHPSAGASISSDKSIFNQSPSATWRTGANAPLTISKLSQMHPLWAGMFSPSDKMVVANGIVYLVASRGTASYLVAIQDGKQAWRYLIPQEDGYIADMQIRRDTVYLLRRATTAQAAADDVLYAVNAHTGQALWEYRPQMFSNMNQAPQKGHNAPEIQRPALSIDHLACTDEHLYFSDTSTLYALDAKTQTLEWIYPFSDPDSGFSSYFPASSPLVAADGNLYLALTTSPYQTGTALLALDARTGSIQWQRSDVGIEQASVQVEDGVLYWNIGLRSERPEAQPGRNAVGLHALEAHNGKELWHSAVSVPASYGQQDGLAVGPDLLYLKGSGRVHAFDRRTGSLVWSSRQLEGSNISIGPVVGHGVVYVGTQTPVRGRMHIEFFAPPPRASYWLYAFDAQSGKLLRMLQQDDSTFAPTVLKADNEHLYVCGGRSFVGGDEAARDMPDFYVLGV